MQNVTIIWERIKEQISTTIEPSNREFCYYLVLSLCFRGLRFDSAASSSVIVKVLTNLNGNDKNDVYNRNQGDETKSPTGQLSGLSSLTHTYVRMYVHAFFDVCVAKGNPFLAKILRKHVTCSCAAARSCVENVCYRDCTSIVIEE
jgi:hypothetical protein